MCVWRIADFLFFYSSHSRRGASARGVINLHRFATACASGFREGRGVVACAPAAGSFGAPVGGGGGARVFEQLFDEARMLLRDVEHGALAAELLELLATLSCGRNKVPHHTARRRR